MGTFDVSKIDLTSMEEQEQPSISPMSHGKFDLSRIDLDSLNSPTAPKPLANMPEPQALQAPQEPQEPQGLAGRDVKYDRQMSLLNTISEGESSGYYGASNRGSIGKDIIGQDFDTMRDGISLTDMTLAEIQKLQTITDPNNKRRLWAVGRYQLIPSTLTEGIKALGLDPKTTKFTQEVQDKLGVWLVLGKRKDLVDWYNRKTDDMSKAYKALYKEFASIPVDKDMIRKIKGKYVVIKKGQSYYPGNQAKHTVEDIKRALNAYRMPKKAGNPDATNLSSVIKESVKHDPKTEAKNLQLSRQAGVPVNIVEGDPKRADEFAKVHAIDVLSLQTKSPLTAAFLTTGRNAIIAQNDISLFTQIENILQTTGDYARNFASQAVAQGVSMPAKGLAETLDIIDRRMGALFDELPEFTSFKEEAEKLKDVEGVQFKGFTTQDTLRILGLGAEKVSEAIDIPKERMTIGKEISGAVGGTLAQVVTAVVSRPAALMSLFSTGVEQQAARQRETGTLGKDALTDAGLLLGGVTTAGLEKVGIWNYLDRLPLKIKNDVGRQVMDIMTAGGVEAVQEVAEGILQSVVERYTSNPDAKIFEGWEHDAIVAGGAGAIVKALVNLATPGKSRTLEETEDSFNEKHEGEQSKIDELITKFEQSETKDLDTEKFREAISKLDGEENTTVFMDADGVHEYLGTLSQEEIDSNPTLVKLSQDIDINATVDMSLEVPIADFAADLVKTDHLDALREYMALSPEQLSPHRKRQHDIDMSKLMDDIQKKVESESVQYVESQEIFNAVREQLVETGRVDPRQATMATTLVPAYMQVFAEQNGMSVRDAWEKHGVTVEGPLTGEKAKRQQRLLEISATSNARTDVVQVLPKDVDKGEIAENIEETVGEDVRNVITELDSAGWLGFDTPVEAINAVFSDEFANMDAPESLRNAANDLIAKRMEPEILEQTDDVKDDVKDDDKVKVRGTFDPANRIIRLTEASNASTFIHEFAHFIYENELVAGTANIKAINKWFKRNVDSVVKEKGMDGVTTDEVILFLDNGTTGNTTTDTKIRKAVHEQFARGFEKYIMEGKAPSLELRNTFEYMSRLLVRVYEKIKGALNVKLDDDMRKLFDSLLATEDQLAAAESRRNYRRMFTEEVLASEDEITAKEYEDYLKAEATAKSKQGKTLRQKLIDQITRVYKAEWKDEKQVIIDEQLKKLRNERVHIARRSLQSDVSIEHIREQIKQVDKDIASLRAKINKIKQGKKVDGIDIDNNTVLRLLSNGEPGKEGLDGQAWLREGLDKADLKIRSKKFKGGLFFKKDGTGKTPDDVAEALNQTPFARGRTITANEAVDIVFDAIRDNDPYIDPDVEALLEYTNSELDNLEQQRVDLEQESKVVNIKLDKAAMMELVGEEFEVKKGRGKGTKRKRLPAAFNKMAVTGGEGMHPEEAAAFLGYDSASQMIDEIMNKPSLKNEAILNAEAEMVARHGDILNDGTIEKEADEAIVTEERGEVILKELRILAKINKRPAIDRAAIKELAEQRVSSMSFNQIKPSVFRRAELKANQEAARLLEKGDKRGAMEAKRIQVFNYYMGMAATKAKDEALKIQDFTTRYRKKTTRERIQKVGGEFWTQIENVLERFDFRKTAPRTKPDASRTEIVGWTQSRMESNGDDIYVAPVVSDEGFKRNWKDLSIDDLRGVRDTLKSIENNARKTSEVNILGEKIEFDRLKAQLLAQLDKVKGNFTWQRTTGKGATGITSLDKMRNSKDATTKFLRSQMAAMTKIADMAYWMDGVERGGAWSELLDVMPTRAKEESNRLIEEIVTPILEKIQSRSKEDSKRMGKLYTFDADIGENGVLYGHQIIAVALNTGNESNLRKMLLGEGWAKDESEVSLDNPILVEILSKLEKSDWVLVQEVWDAMDQLLPSVAKVHKDSTGLELTEVEAVPFTNEHGTFRGGYYPLKYDSKRSEEAAKFNEKRDASHESLFSISASYNQSVSAGSVNNRTEFVAPIDLDLNVISEHFNEVIHYITHYDTVKVINQVINDPEISKKIKNKMGEEEYAEMRPWLNDVAKDGRNLSAKEFLAPVFKHFRHGQTLVYLGYKISTLLVQPLGLMAAASQVGGKRLTHAIWQVTKDIPTRRGQNWAIRDFVFANSAIMRYRVKSRDREMLDTLKALQGKSGFKARTEEFGLLGIGYVQTYVVDLPTWVAAYDKEMAESGNHDKAVEIADTIVESTQGSGQISKTSRMLRTRNEFARLFFAFFTWFSAQWNMQRGLVRGARSGRFSALEVSTKAFYLFVATAIGDMAVRGELVPEDDEDTEDFLKRVGPTAAIKSITAPAQSIPLVRDIANSFVSGFGYNVGPTISILEKGIEGIKGIDVDGEMSDSEIKSLLILGGTLFKITGTAQAVGTGQHIHDVMTEGEDFTTWQLLFGPDRK